MIGDEQAVSTADTGTQGGRLLVIVPVKNKRSVLRPCLTSIARAVASTSDTQLVILDNLSTDGSREILEEFGDRAHILTTNLTRIGAIRNVGARYIDSELLVFVDADCVVRDDFCRSVRTTLLAMPNHVVGCTYQAPAPGHWIERTLEALQRNGGDGYRKAVPGGCLGVSRILFEAVGAFNERLIANEDFEFCDRARRAGAQIWQSEALSVVHLGNPQSIRALFRQLVWHSQGAVSDDGSISWSPMFLFTVFHAAFSLCALVLGVLAILQRQLAFAGFAVALACIFPLLLYVTRMVQRRRLVNPVRGIMLMHVVLAARARGSLSRL